MSLKLSLPLPLPLSLPHEGKSNPEMISELTKKLLEYHYSYDPIENPESLVIVYNLFMNPSSLPPKITDLGDHPDPIILSYFSAYYYYVLQNHVQARTCALIGAYFGCQYSLYTLGFMSDRTSDFQSAKRYMEMAAKKGNIQAMEYLGGYYDEIEINPPEVEKYYKMAATLGSFNAMLMLAIYYEKSEATYNDAKTYFIMAINAKCEPMVCMMFATFCKDNIKDIQNMKKYYKLAITQDNIIDSIFSQYNNESKLCAMQELIKYYENYENNLEELEELLQLAKTNHDIEKIKQLINRLKSENRPPVAIKVKADDPDIIICAICKCNQRNTCFKPCRHAATCHICANQWMTDKKECPICRQPIWEIINFDLS